MNDIKKILHQIILSCLIVIVCFILQTAIFSRFTLANVTPNILICVVSAYGFMKGQKEGLITGFAVGLILDFYSGSYLGIYALIYMYIGFLNGYFKKLFYGDELRLPLVLIAASDFVYGLLSYVFLYFTRSRYEFTYYLKTIVLPEVVYTVLVSIFIYYAILSLNNHVEKMEKKGSDRFGAF